MAQKVLVADPLNVSGSARGDHEGFICRTAGSEVKRVFSQWQILCGSQAPMLSPRSMPPSQSLLEVLDCLERAEALWKAVAGGMDKGTHNDAEWKLAGLGKDLDAQVLNLEEEWQQTRWAQARSRADIVRQLVRGRSAAAAAAMAAAEAASRSADSEDLRSTVVDIAQLADLGQLDPSPDSRALMENAYRQAEQEFKTQLDMHASALQEERQMLQQRLEKLSDDSSKNAKKHEDLVARLKEKLLKKTGRIALPTPTSVMVAGKMDEAKKLPPIRDGGSNSSKGVGRGSSASRGGGSSSSARETLAEDASSANRAKRWGIHFVEQLGVNSYPTKPVKWHGCMEELRRNVTPRHARTREEAMQQRLEMTNTVDLMERIGSILELPRVQPAFNAHSSMDSFPMTDESSMEFRSMEFH